MLDDKDDSLRDRLKGYQEEPDENLWGRIKSELPGNSIKDQLSNYEEDPDAVVWRSIQSEIEASQSINWVNHASYIITAAALLTILLFQFTINDHTEGKASPMAVEKLHAPASDTIHKLSEIKSSSDSLLINNARSNPKTKSDISVNRKELSKLSSRVNKDSRRRAVRSNKEYPVTSATAGKFNLKEDTLAKTAGNNIVNSAMLSANQQDASELPVRRALETTIPAAIDSSERSNELKALQQSGTTVDSVKQDNINLLAKDQALKIDSTAGKQEKKEKRSNTGSGVYVLVMPTFGYQELNPIKTDNIVVESLQKISAFSLSRLGIRAEIGWEKEIAKRLILNVGVLYFQRKQTITYNYLDPSRSELKASDSIPLLFVSNPHQLTGTFEYELKNIGIHTGLSYEVKTDRIAHRLGLGIELQKGFSKSDLELPVSSSLYLFGNIYYRISYPISNHVDLIVQPTFNYSFKVSEQLGAPFYVKPYGLGLSVGASFRLGNR